MREAEALVPQGALQAAIEALEQGEEAVAAAGFFPGGAPSTDPYATVWEFDRVAAELRKQGTSSNAASLAAGTEPVELRRVGTTGTLGTVPAAARRLTPFVVHSFAGRRGHARPEVVPLVPPSARTVLDVGCGEGALGAALAGHGLDVTGVEADPEAAAIAATRLRRVVNASLEESWDELAEQFDAVLACDLLEHLEDPIAALRSLRGRLKKDGVLILSVPNGSNTAVLAGALMGRWDPALEGVVADDHRTYSGRLGWERVLRAGGFRIERWAVSGFESMRLAPWHQALCSTGVPAEEFAAIQWLGVARVVADAEALELGMSGFGLAGLDADDPVQAIARTLEQADSVTHIFVNAASASVLDSLFRGDVAMGPSRAALVGGVTRHGLLARFAGSGIAVAIQPAGECRVAPSIDAICKEAISRGLPVDEDGLRTTTWRAVFTRGSVA